MAEATVRIHLQGVEDLDPQALIDHLLDSILELPHVGIQHEPVITVELADGPCCCTIDAGASLCPVHASTGLGSYLPVG